MKILVVKEVDQYIDKFLEVMGYTDPLLLSFEDYQSPYKVIKLEYEDRSEAKSIAVKFALDSGFTHILYYPTGCVPLTPFPEVDPNISLAYTDYIDDRLQIQRIGPVFLRRLESSENIFDPSKCQGIIYYIPEIHYERK